MRQLVNPRTFGCPTIALARFGCANRPFYRVVVFPDKALGRHWEGNIIEQVGSFDPLPNERNEKLVSLNIDRIKYWMGVRNANVSVSALELLGLSGLLPLHPKTFLRARQNRFKMMEDAQNAEGLSQIGDDPSESVSSPNRDEEQHQLEETGESETLEAKRSMSD